MWVSLLKNAVSCLSVIARSTVDPSSELSPGNGDVVSDAGSEQNQLDELPLSPGMNILNCIISF